MRTKKEGFTLVELMVVISIIALLMAIFLPSLNKAKELAKRQYCANNLKQTSIAIHAYTGDYDYSLPWWGYSDTSGGNLYGGDPEGHPYIVYRGGDATVIQNVWRFPPGVAEDPWNPGLGKMKPMRQACLYEGKYISKPEVFYCPSNRMDLYKFESYTDPPPWGRLPQNYNTHDKSGGTHNQWVRVGYEYYPTDPKTPVDADHPEYWHYHGTAYNVPKETARKLTGLNPHIPYMSDVIRNIADISHQTRSSHGIHALFSDGHVIFRNDERLFSGPEWEDFRSGAINWRLFYYMIYRQVSP